MKTHLFTSDISDVFDRVTDGIVAFDPEMNYTYVNRRAGEFARPKA